LRITEDVAGRRDHIIVPSTGLAEFARVLTELAKTSDALPPMAQQAPEGGAGGNASAGTEKPNAD
jgi:hypothetical protein